MSGKNRAFALAVATAALVGLSAPVAGAATLQDGPGQFNNDSIFSVSGNQLPVQTCTFGAAAQTLTGTETLAPVTSILPILSTGTLSPTQDSTCTQSSAQVNTTTVNTTPTTGPVGGPNNGPNYGPSYDPSYDPDANSFNNDSILNVSQNQLPTQVCTIAAPVQTAAVTESLAPVMSLFPVLSTGAVTPLQDLGCSQDSTQGNTTNFNSSNS